MDEPTTALDVVVERGILRRVQELQERLGFAMLFITHDLALLLELATRIGVMYAGRMTEIAPVDAFRSGGLHPYTRGLFGAIPPAIGEDRVPTSIRGNAASIAAPPSGCRFHPRCDQAIDSCSAVVPELSAVESNHTVACPVVTGAAA
ncbi:MAG: peptide/nickel transport system ATP-binding protein [bacterium]|jgi:peptide/nickel transport system ATP-binding protein